MLFLQKYRSNYLIYSCINNMNSAYSFPYITIFLLKNTQTGNFFDRIYYSLLLLTSNKPNKQKKLSAKQTASFAIN
jgi:hypothetical protein